MARLASSPGREEPVDVAIGLAMQAAKLTAYSVPAPQRIGGLGLAHAYPALEGSTNAMVSAMSKRYQAEMGSIAVAYSDFASKWNTGQRIASDPESFRAEANKVFKALHERIQKENRELYPAAEVL